jgi:Predicted transcriptional regulators
MQGGVGMNTKEVLYELRTKNGLSQDDLAEKVFVTRQAVSRWENGETVPNTETLKQLSKLFNVSINTLLGSPNQLICQCCGMPLDDSIIGKNKDGTLNEDYCQWCYADGTYTYSNMDDLIDVCVGHMVNENFSEEQARIYLKQTLPKLDYWKKYEELSDNGQFEEFKQQLIREINDLHIEGMPEVKKLNALVGSYVNLAYRLPSGANVKFLDDHTTYLGNQLESELGGDRCFGILANMDFILVCTYEAEGANPELVLYKKR